MATTSTAQPAPTLSFPRPIFAALSPHPFLQAHLTAAHTPLRANGRPAHAFRAPGVHTGSLTHSSGSAVVRLGNTSVVCGVRAEILASGDAPDAAPTPSEKEEPEDLDREREEMAALRLLVPNVELSTGSTPQHIPGSAPSAAAQSLVARLHALLLATSVVHLSDLRITHTPPANVDDPEAEPRTEVRGYWVLYIDVFFISIDGGALDAAWLSLLAALRDTRLPHAFWDEECEAVLCSDEPARAKGLRLRGMPVAASFAVFEGRREGDEDGEEEEEEEVNWVLSDPDAFEESVCRESVCVVVDCSRGETEGVVRRVEKSGGGVVGREDMRVLVKRAVERWGVVDQVLKGV